MKQVAYARRIFGAEGKNRRQIALDVGYSPSAANSVKQKIEDTRGFNNAMTKLAVESNNLAMTIMHEFKVRGVSEFSNKDLVGALNAIGSAWSRFNAVPKEREKDNGTNRLRTVILQSIGQQTLNTERPPDEVVHEMDPSDPMDF